TTAFCVLGYCRTDRLVNERMPSTRISRLIVTASTGLRMNRSVKFMCAGSLFLWLRVGIVRWLHRVIDDQRRIVLEFHLPAGHHFGAGLDALQDRDLIAPFGTCGDENLLREEARVALFVLVFLLVRPLDDEHGVAIGIEGDRGLRQRQIAGLF